MAVDFQGAKALEEVLALCRARGVRLLVCAAQAHPMRMMTRTGFSDELGLEHFCGDFAEALQRAAAVPSR